MQQRGSTADPTESQQALKPRNKYCRKLARSFERSRARLLYHECSEEEKAARYNELVDLFCWANDFFSRLWSQKVYIKALDGKTLLKEPFSIDLDECEAHAAHKLEEDDDSKNELPIQMVVEPGILAYGNELGESYEVFKVWGKAVVWLSSGGNGSKVPLHTTVSGGPANHGLDTDELT